MKAFASKTWDSKTWYAKAFNGQVEVVPAIPAYTIRVKVPGAGLRNVSVPGAGLTNVKVEGAQ